MIKPYPIYKSTYPYSSPKLILLANPLQQLKILLNIIKQPRLKFHGPFLGDGQGFAIVQIQVGARNTLTVKQVHDHALVAVFKVKVLNLFHDLTQNAAKFKIALGGAHFNLPPHTLKIINVIAGKNLQLAAHHQRDVMALVFLFNKIKHLGQHHVYLSRVKGLDQVFKRVHSKGVAHVVSVAGDKDNLDPGVPLADLLGRINPIGFRHLHVKKKDIKLDTVFKHFTAVVIDVCLHINIVFLTISDNERLQLFCNQSIVVTNPNSNHPIHCLSSISFIIPYFLPAPYTKPS